jgi:hypothetical protein
MWFNSPNFFYPDLFITSFQLISTLFKNFLITLCSSFSDSTFVWLMKYLPHLNWSFNFPNTTVLNSPPNANSKSNLMDSNPDLPRLIAPYQIISNLMNNFILLLTFGLCSPLLGFSISLNIYLCIWSWLMLIGRFISFRVETFPIRPISLRHSSTHHDSYFLNDPFLNLLNSQLYLVNSSLLVCKWPIICISSLFITMLSWDMVGDEVGWFGGWWVPVVGLSLMALIWLWDRVLLKSEIKSSSDSHPIDPTHSSLHHQPFHEI